MIIFTFIYIKIGITIQKCPPSHFRQGDFDIFEVVFKKFEFILSQAAALYDFLNPLYLHIFLKEKFL